MTTITKDNIAQISKDLEDALKAVAAKHGLQLSKKRIRYNSDSFTMTSDFVTTTSLAETTAELPGQASAYRPDDLKNFNRHSWKFGLNQDHLGKTALISGENVRLVGMAGYSRLMFQRDNGTYATGPGDKFAKYFL